MRYAYDCVTKSTVFVWGFTTVIPMLQIIPIGCSRLLGLHVEVHLGCCRMHMLLLADLSNRSIFAMIFCFGGYLVYHSSW